MLITTCSRRCQLCTACILVALAVLNEVGCSECDSWPVFLPLPTEESSHCMSESFFGHRTSLRQPRTLTDRFRPHDDTHISPVPLLSAGRIFPFYASRSSCLRTNTNTQTARVHMRRCVVATVPLRSRQLRCTSRYVDAAVCLGSTSLGDSLRAPVVFVCTRT